MGSYARGNYVKYFMILLRFSKRRGMYNKHFEGMSGFQIRDCSLKSKKKSQNGAAFKQKDSSPITSSIIIYIYPKV